METHSEADPGEAIGAFLESFGTMDLYSQIVLEELLEILLEKKE